MELYKKRISDLGRIVTGKTPRTSIAQNYGGNIPFLTPSDDLSGKYAPKTMKTITEEGLSKVKNCLLPPKSVCVSCIGSDLGKVVITNEPTVTNQQFNSIIPTEENDTDYIYYLMTIVGKQLNFLSKTSTAVPIINKSTFANFEIEVPYLENQQRIAKVLSSLDDKIEINRRINDNFYYAFFEVMLIWLLTSLENDNLEQQAQAMFKSWFVDFEPFKNGEFVNSEQGMIPKGWKAGSLEDITAQKAEKVCDRVDMKVLSPVTTGQLMLSEEYFTKQVFSESITKYKVVEIGDFAYNPARVNIGSLGRNNYNFDGCVSPVYVVFSCKDGYAYLFDLYRKTEKFKTEVNLRAIGGVRQSLNYKDFTFIQCIIPPLHVVENFNVIYEHFIDMQKHTYEESERLVSLRDTLLPRLMSGELNLNVTNL